MSGSRRLLAPPRDVGVTWVVGVPQSGKTTYALSVAWSFARARGVPLLVVDSIGERKCAPVEAARSLAELVDHVWSERRALARFEPSTLEDVEGIARAVHRGKDVAVVIDEAAFWLTGHARPDSELLRLMRSTQHARARLWLTTQHLSGDVPQAAISCAPELVIFRCTSPAVLRRLERDYGIDPARVQALPQGRFLRVRTGFGDFA